MSNVTQDGTSQFIEVSYWVEPNISSTSVMFFSSNSEIYGSLSVFYDHATRFDIAVPSTDRRSNKKVTFTLEQAMKAQTDE